MKQLLFIALGGALGAVSRYGMVNAIHRVWESRFPFGTLAVNLIGSFLIGMMYVFITEKMYLHPEWRNVIIIGFLGAFTTFSTFSLEAITFMQNGQLNMALYYTLASVLFCIVAAWAGIELTRLM